MVARLIPNQEARVRFLLTVPFTGVPLEGRKTPNLAKWVRFPQPLPLHALVSKPVHVPVAQRKRQTSSKRLNAGSIPAGNTNFDSYADYRAI